MASKPDRRQLANALAATAMSAVGWWFGGQLHPIWWLTWLAPLPILWLSTRVRTRWAVLAAFAAVAIGGIPYWSYCRSVIGIPVAGTLAVILTPAVIFMLATSLYRRLALRGRHLAAAFAVPAVVVAGWFLSAMTSPHGTWGNPGYTQMDALIVIQMAAVTGVAGVAFLVMLGPACVAVLCNGSASPAARLRTLLVAGGLIALALAFGTWRLYQAPRDSGTPVKIGLVALRHAGIAPLNSAAGQRLLQRHVDHVRKLAARGARIVALPEKIWAAPQPGIPALAALAQREGVTVVAGMDLQTPGEPERNVALAFNPRDRMPIVYVKHHLLPFLMPRFEPGHDYTMLGTMPHTGLVICKDLDFPAMGRSYAMRGARLLLVPAWDFDVDGWLHSRMAIMRGVESGLAIARVARDGRLTLSDDRGRVLAEANSAGRDARLLGTLPLRDTHTPYARWGDWFAWLDMAALMVLLVLAGWGTGKRKT